MPEILVVGAGPAGLAAALAAARAGRSVTVVDHADRIGGMAASITVAGQRVDLGSHRLHMAAPPPVAALLDELLGADLQTRTRNGRLRIGDRWIGFPFGTGEMLGALGARRGVTMAAELALAPTRRPRADTYAEVIRAGLGPTALATFHGPMATKLWGVPPDRLAGELARRRIAVRSPGAVVRRLVATRNPDGRRFRYPRLGYGQIVERLADAATDAGATICTGVAVDALHVGPAGVQVDGVQVDGVQADGVQVHGGATSWDVERVLWTVPVDALATLAARPGAGLPPAPRTAPLTHRAMVLVYAVVDRNRWLDADAHYVPDPAVPYARISEPKQYRDGPDPTGTTVLCLEVPCTIGDDAWTRTEAGWRDRLDPDLASIALPATATSHVEVVRLPHVYPVIGPDDVDDRAATLAWAAALDRIAVFGRQGLHVGDNLHHVVDMGLSAAACLRSMGDGWDATAWAAARERFAAFVVED